jgi:RNA polymerase sigma-70 factor, ECF subfamily
VSRSSEVIDVTDRPLAEFGGSIDRASAFAVLADEHLDAAYRLARAILRDPDRAQDATHDAFVQAWRKWSTLRDPARFQQWFDRILVNTCRDGLRASRWQARDISDEVALVSGDAFGQTHDRDVLGAGIASLSADHRVVVALRYYRDLPVKDIAALLSVPVGTVESRLHYALKRLHELIDVADSKGTVR